MCPECGYHIKEQLGSSIDSHVEFNEAKPYSPISSKAWIFKTPFPLNQYPRGAFAKEHPSLGWLFGPFHIANNGNVKDREYYDVINNVLFLLNICSKFTWFTTLWLIIKTWWIVLIEIILLCICFSHYDTVVLGIVLIPIFTIISIPFVISAICASYHRYVPIMIKTYRRIRKRHWVSMYKAVKHDNLNLD